MNHLQSKLYQSAGDFLSQCKPIARTVPKFPIVDPIGSNAFMIELPRKTKRLSRNGDEMNMTRGQKKKIKVKIRFVPKDLMAAVFSASSRFSSNSEKKIFSVQNLNKPQLKVNRFKSNYFKLLCTLFNKTLKSFFEILKELKLISQN